MSSKKDPDDAGLSAIPPPLSFVAPSNKIVTPQDDAKGKAETRSRLVSAGFVQKVVREVAYRCEISDERIRAIYSNGKQSELLFSQIAALIVRQLPDESPWESKIMLDLLPNITEPPKRPIRLFSVTYVNYAWLPQGASPSSQENLRRLANFVVSRNGEIAIDGATAQFLQTGKNPLRFLNGAQFAEYDSRYDF